MSVSFSPIDLSRMTPWDPARLFLSRALPWGDAAEGWLNVHRKTPSGWPGRSFRTIDGMLQEIDRLKQRFDVYCCMSSQGSANERSVRDARFLKSLFIDVDVKPGFYNTTIEALMGLNAFQRVVGLPAPTMRVMSGGGGFHCHWILVSPLAKADWLKLAKALQRAVRQHGLVVDRNVIADAARLLRIPGAFNTKYPARPAVTLDTGVVERDYFLDEIAGPLEPYMRAPDIAATTNNSPPRPLSKRFDGAPCDNADLCGASGFDFAEFKAAVEHLTAKGWFDLHQYDHWRDFVFAAAYVALTEPALENEIRALIDAIRETVGRDPEKAEKLFLSGMERAGSRLRAGEDVVRPGTIFAVAREQGWASPGQPASPKPIIADADLRLAEAKGRMRDCYRRALSVSRPHGLQRLVETVIAVEPSIRDAVRRSAIQLLAADGWPMAALTKVGVEIGLEARDAARLSEWAVRHRSLRPTHNRIGFSNGIRS
jgi:hypothetical protein